MLRPPSWRALVATLACAACGGSTHSPSSSAARDAEARDSADESAPPAMTCPIATPSAGEACGPPEQSCEYGSGTVPECDTLATCNGGRWEVTSPMEAQAICVSGPASECPASRPGVPVGQSCGPAGLSCDYPEGRCACATPELGDGLDAAASASWACFDPGPGCPLPRPRLGTACSGPLLVCDYGGCTIPGGILQVCESGEWRVMPERCPG